MKYLLILLSLSLVFFNTNAQVTDNQSTELDTLSGELKILAWNIYLLPTLIVRKGQKKRVPYIGELLDTMNYDVLVFSEAFHKRSRKRLAKKLRDTYSHQTKPLNHKRFIKLNGGVWIVSKLPIKVLHEIRFEDCKASDCFAKKGAMLVEIEKNGQPFQILGTHLQADYTGKAFQPIRDQQYEQIKKELLIPFQQKDVPQLICGDLNTPTTDTLAYRAMLSTWEAADGTTEGGNYTYVSEDFKNPDDPWQEQYDYILYRGNCKKTSQIERTIHQFKREWKEGKTDLSDHYAIEAIIRWQ